jgi:hypothetical protein
VTETAEFKKNCLATTRLGSENAEKVLQPALDATWALIENSSGIIGGAADIVLRGKDDDEVLLLLKLANCISDTLSALITTTQGFTHPPLVVMRAVLESLACVICFRQDEKAFSAYKAGKYNTPDAISVAKKTNPEFGKLNGMLSNAFTHEEVRGTGRALVTKDRTTALILIPPLDEDFNKHPLLALLVIASIAYKIGEVTEWCFARLLPKLQHWERVDKNTLTTISSPQKELLKTITAQVEEKLEELQKAKGGSRSSSA